MSRHRFLHIALGLFLLVAPRPRLEAKTPPESHLTSEVRIFKGTPALYVNGKLTSQVLAAPYIPGPADFTDFTKAGISIFNIYLRFDWKGPEEYDFQKIDAKMDEYLKLKPDALFIPRILLTPDDWWCTTFPEDITMRDDGSPAGMFGKRCHPTPGVRSLPRVVAQGHEGVPRSCGGQIRRQHSWLSGGQWVRRRVADVQFVLGDAARDSRLPPSSA